MNAFWDILSVILAGACPTVCYDKNWEEIGAAADDIATIAPEMEFCEVDLSGCDMSMAKPYQSMMIGFC
jgi:hypothetical protein